MDKLNEKILSAYNKSILGIVDESKKIGKPIIKKVIDFIDARHTGDAKTALKVHKELKKKLGNSFSKVLLKYGDPDDPSTGYMNVRNQWANSLQEEETELDEQVKAKNIKLTFRVWPASMKPRTYKDLNGMAKDFSEEQLKNASISLLIGASIITTLEDYAVERLLDEIF